MSEMTKSFSGLKVGMEFKVLVSDDRLHAQKKYIKYKINKIYKNYIDCVRTGKNQWGEAYTFHEGFTIGDFVIFGIVEQLGITEQLSGRNIKDNHNRSNG